LTLPCAISKKLSNRLHPQKIQRELKTLAFIFELNLLTSLWQSEKMFSKESNGVQILRIFLFKLFQIFFIQISKNLNCIKIKFILASVAKENPIVLLADFFLEYINFIITYADHLPILVSFVSLF